MPTGGGKSICYQLPALCLEGLAIVVSPLIALMEDQVLGLQELGVNAIAFNSSDQTTSYQNLYEEIDQQKLKLIYVSPEKLNTLDFQDFLQRIKISLFAIDESHCVSVWGNDFRPDYTTICKTRDLHSNVPFIALTATADASTQKDIIAQLHLKNPKTYLSSFERKNILTSAVPGQKRIEQIEQFIREQDGAGIIYCLSRKSTEDLSKKLNQRGFISKYYHAGMDANSRKSTQQEFVNDEINIICATIAFGMGIDKSNIKWVIHYNMPKNIEGYYQEIGRSGRDGSQAEALLFYSFYDYEMLKSFIEDSDADSQFKQVQKEKLDRMWEFATTYDCRTNIVLNYFGEFRNVPCGHCDNCLNPPKQIDGTILAQMALSAIVRCNELLNIDLLIGVLRGSYRSDIKAAGFTEIKTFGVGRSYSILHWRSYITQFINQGLIFIDYADKSRLKLTDLAPGVLKGKKVNIVEFVKNKPKPKVLLSKKEENLNVIVDLLNDLKKWRAEEAASNRIPPYIVFNDKTLNELASKVPQTLSELNAISGIGAAKLEKYGSQILNITGNYGNEDKNQLETVKVTHIAKPVIPIKNKEKGIATTYQETYTLLQEGKSPEGIAEIKALSLTTIFNHIAYLWKIGKQIDLYNYISFEEVEEVKRAIVKTNEKEKSKILFDFLEGELPYYKIRLALALINK